MKKKRLLRKITTRFLLGLAVIIVLWLGYSFFTVIRYQPLELANLDVPGDYYELRGAVHLHSNRTDGTWEPHRIQEAAKEENLDFLVLTDDGTTEDFKAVRSKEKSPIFIAGTERRTDKGHVLGYGFTEGIDEFHKDTVLTFDAIEKAGGIAVLAHPGRRKNGWQDYSVEGYSGIEVLNFSEVVINMNRGKAFLLIPQALFNLRGTLANITDYPKGNIKRWDELNRDRKILAFCGVDAHGPKYLGFPPYGTIIAGLNIHIIISAEELKNRTPQLINRALKEGRFYMALDAMADSCYFEFKLMTPSGEIYHTGNVVPYRNGCSLLLSTAAPEGAYARIIKDGELLTEIRNLNCTIPLNEPGIYRAEIWIPEEKTHYRNDKVWIISNPIYFIEKIRIKQYSE
jgi:hypothetical protein